MTPTPVTAAAVIIGNEILSGRTQDQNLSWLAERLGALGIRLLEARVVRDDTAAIVAAVRALSPAHDYLFTTGGIGPTHDDITLAGVAAAFGRAVVRHAEAEARLRDHYARRGLEATAARLRMAEAAEGAELVAAPGAGLLFRVENVYALAGIPRIMQLQFEALAPRLRRGLPIASRVIDCSLGEGVFAAALAAVQDAHRAVEIGSYPYDRGGHHRAQIVLRAADTAALAAATAAVVALLAERGGDPVEAV